MLKRFAAGFVMLTLLIALAVGGLWSGAGSLVKGAIEKYGSQITGTKVHVDSVSLSLSTGEGTISGLTIANPEGFSAHNALEMKSISIRIDTNSLMANGPITIQSVTIEAPHVAFEGQGVDNNLQVIERHARSASRHDEVVQENGGTKQERKLIISDLDIREGQLSVSHAQLGGGKAFAVPLSEIHLKDIGKAEDGATPAETAQQLIATITQSAIQDANTGLAKGMGALKPGMDQGVGAIKGLLGR